MGLDRAGLLRRYVTSPSGSAEEPPERAHAALAPLEAQPEPETVGEAYASRAVYAAPPWQVDAWVSQYTAIASGEVAGVTDDVPRLVGHPVALRDEREPRRR